MTFKVTKEVQLAVRVPAAVAKAIETVATKHNQSTAECLRFALQVCYYNPSAAEMMENLKGDELQPQDWLYELLEYMNGIVARNDETNHFVKVRIQEIKRIQEKLRVDVEIFRALRAGQLNFKLQPPPKRKRAKA